MAAGIVQHVCKQMLPSSVLRTKFERLKITPGNDDPADNDKRRKRVSHFNTKRGVMKMIELREVVFRNAIECCDPSQYPCTWEHM